MDIRCIIDFILHLPSSIEFWIGVLVPAALILIFWKRRYHSESVSVGLPFGLGSATYDTSPADRIVAWRLYVQLITRKAALPFDERYDLISDVYDSLFELFKITRELLLELPPREFQRKEGISSLMLRVLNDGVRPHLTRWQAEYRKWLSGIEKSDEYKGMSPQEIQRKFPRYVELVEDLKRTNTELSKFADELRELSHPTRRRRARRKKVVPQAPTTRGNEIHR